MNSVLTSNWVDANQRYLSGALSLVRVTLKRYIGDHLHAGDAEEAQEDIRQGLAELASHMPAPSALTVLCETFDLSPFERDMLLLCAGVEFDGGFAALCAEAQHHFWDEQHRTTRGQEGSASLNSTGQGMSSPTFALALSVLDGAHWNALTPVGPLRRWRLIEVGHGSVLTLSPLRIDEGILHYLAGTPYLDERLARLVRPISASGELVPSHQVLAERLATIWGEQSMEHATLRKGRMPLVQLYGEDVTGKQMIVANASETIGLKLYMVSAHVLLSMPLVEVEAFMHLWEREATLSRYALLVDCEDADLDDKEWTPIRMVLMQEMRGKVVIACHERLTQGQSLQGSFDRTIISFEVRKPHRNEQVVTWQNELGTMAGDELIERLMGQFNLGTATIQAVCREVLGDIRTGTSPVPARAGEGNGGIRTEASLVLTSREERDFGRELWDACRSQTRVRLEDLAQRIDAVTGWEDLVLPEEQRRLLQEIVMHVRRRVTVYDTWGFSERGGRGLGMSVLFAGASGTGKTSAAEVLACELRLDLYRIDLSATVSKYIGETEKNLRMIFDAAEEGGAILLFDEADALFGKRSEVKDSRDRYANIEVSYLLQRMEAYRGLAILTTNFKSALDSAFLRRIRFVMQFPFPDIAQRAEIWRRSFPARTPTEGLDMEKLARLHIAGGNIRNIALNAAFLAADAQMPVRMEHILRAAHAEYAKLERTPTESEFGGWL